MKKGFLIVMGAILIAGGAAGLVSTQLLGTGGESAKQGGVIEQQAQGTVPARPESAPPQVLMDWPKIAAQPEAASGDETRMKEEELRRQITGSNEKRTTAEPSTVLKGERRFPKQVRIAKEEPAPKKQKAAARGKTGKYASARQKQKTVKAKAHSTPSRYAARPPAKRYDAKPYREQQQPRKQYAAELPPVDQYAIQPLERPYAERPFAGQYPAPVPRGGYAAAPRSVHAKPVVIRFRFDPAREGEIQVARVHLGDRVETRIRKQGEDGGRLYLGFNSRERVDRSDLPYNRDMNLNYQSYQVRTLIEDGYRLTIGANREFDPSLVNALGSEKGAVLKLGVNRADADGPRRRYSAPGRAHYEIELRIYSENRMNIPPRSLI